MHLLVGGMASSADRYGLHCAGKMWYLRRKFPDCFWADPAAFFTDGPLVNLGADVGVMPSLFEPGGIVQQEFFVAGARARAAVAVAAATATVVNDATHSALAAGPERLSRRHPPARYPGSGLPHGRPQGHDRGVRRRAGHR